jgi:hypothetical protein
MTNWDMAQIDLAELAHKASSGWGQTPSPRLGPTEGQTDRFHRPHLAPLLDPDAALAADRRLRPAPATLATIVGRKWTGPC